MTPLAAFASTTLFWMLYDIVAGADVGLTPARPPPDRDPARFDCDRAEEDARVRRCGGRWVLEISPSAR